MRYLARDFHDAKVKSPLRATDGVVTGVAVARGSAEQLSKNGNGPRREVLGGKELCADLNCDRG